MNSQAQHVLVGSLLAAVAIATLIDSAPAHRAEHRRQP